MISRINEGKEMDRERERTNNEKEDDDGNDACVFLLNECIEEDEDDDEDDVQRDVWSLWIGNVNVIAIVTQPLFSIVAPETR